MYFLFESRHHYVYIVRLAPLLSDLVPRYAVNVDARREPLLAGGSHAQELALVDTSPRIPGDDLVPFGDLVINGEADVGEGGSILCNSQYVGLAIGSLLAGHQAPVDEVRGHHLPYLVEVTLGVCLVETADQSLLLLRWHGPSSSSSTRLPQWVS